MESPGVLAPQPHIGMTTVSQGSPDWRYRNSNHAINVAPAADTAIEIAATTTRVTRPSWGACALDKKSLTYSVVMAYKNSVSLGQLRGPSISPGLGTLSRRIAVNLIRASDYESARGAVTLSEMMVKDHLDDLFWRIGLVGDRIDLNELAPEPTTAEGLAAKMEERYQLALEDVRLHEQWVLESPTQNRGPREAKLLRVRAKLSELCPI